MRLNYLPGFVFTVVLSAGIIFSEQGLYAAPVDTIKPSPAFIQGIKAAFDSGYVAKDTVQIFTGYSKFSNSDLSTTIVSNAPDFRRIIKVWSVIIKGTRFVKFQLNPNHAQNVSPFIGIEEWDFYSEEDAQKCIDMLKNPIRFGSASFKLHKPPREFVMQGNRIFYFYTYPNDFYPDLVNVRDIFLQFMVHPDLVK